MKGFAGKNGNLGWIAADSAAFALSGLKVDRFRTILSLAGVSIGIFSIVSVFTVIGSLQDSLNSGLEEFGSDVVFIEQIPLEADLNENGIFKWWEYISRPQVSYNDYLCLKEHGTTFGDISWSCFLKDGNTIGVTSGWEMSIHNKISAGRTFSEAELMHGSAVAIAGSDYAENRRIDSVVSLCGIRCTIIGTFGKSGISSVSLSDIDNSIIVPAPFAMRLEGFSGCRSSIAVRPARNVSEETFRGEINSLMRRSRRLGPGMKDNFSINSLSFIVNEMNGLFSTVDKIGWITGLFSLLVGAFGIANIMFVSVKERTPEIGLQKAVGAGRRTIIFQYLTEATTLSALGGASGIILVWLITLLLRQGPVPISMRWSDVLTGLATSLIIGIAAGVAPATAAANLNPAEALQKQ